MGYILKDGYSLLAQRTLGSAVNQLLFITTIIMRNSLFITLVFFLLLSCRHNKNGQFVEILKTIEMDSTISYNEIGPLQENLSLFSEIASFTFINDSLFAISSVNPAQVLLYNTVGNQVLQIGKRGNGPYEYISPAIIRTFNSQIYVWCNMRLKLIVFDLKGNPLKEYTNFKKGIKDFLIYDRLLCVYSSGGYDDPVVQFYDLETREFVEKGFGEQTNEHKILNAYACSGGLTCSKNKILFASNDALIIYEVDMQNNTLNKVAIQDTEFKVEKVETNPKDFMADVFKSTKYVFGSDIITGLYAIDNHLILTAEVGGIELEGLQLKDVSKKRQLFYVFDNSSNLLYKVKSKPIPGCSSCLYATNRDHLYAILYNDKDSKFHLVEILYHQGK